MASFYSKLTKYLGEEPDFRKVVLISDSADGIVEWHYTNKSQPSQSDLDALETEANALETEIANRPTDRINAINKLKGATYSPLTDAEAKALFGS